MNKKWEKFENFVPKIAIIGDDGTGKTSLLARYVDDTFSQEYISSVKKKKKKN